MDEPQKERVFYIDLPVEYNSDLDLMEKLISIYSRGYECHRQDSILLKRHLPLMAYYLLYGYSVGTYTQFAKDKRLSIKYINVLNSELVQLGYLINPYGERTVRKLAPHVERLRMLVKKQQEANDGKVALRMMMVDKRIHKDFKIF